MAKSAQAFSAKDFRDPLLKVLAMHTKFDSGRRAKADDLYGPVCKMMGVNPDDYGCSGEVLWIQKWIQWAFQDLRREGLGVKHSRGTWGLTPNGVDRARSKMMTAAATTTMDEQDLDDLANMIAGENVVVTSVDVGTYHLDSYLCKVGLANHKCMGFFTDQSPMCVMCPAHILCQRHKITKLVTLALELDEEDKSERMAQQIQATLTPDPMQTSVFDRDPQAEPDRYHPPVGTLVIEQTCSGTAVCDHCGRMINAGEASVWVRKIGPNKNKSLMLHRECCIVDVANRSTSND